MLGLRPIRGSPASLGGLLQVCTLLNQAQIVEWIDRAALRGEDYLLLQQSGVILSKFGLPLPRLLQGHHLGPSLHAVQEEDHECGSTPPVLLAPREYQLPFEYDVGLLSLLLIVLGKDPQAREYFLLYIPVEFFIVLREATVQEPQSQ